MNPLLQKPVLVTGASGNIGRFLVKSMAQEGSTLRLSDVVPFPDPLPANASFRRCDLGGPLEVMRLAEGCGVLVHFGGASHDQWPFEDIAMANLRGTYHVYEAALVTAAAEADEVGLATIWGVSDNAHKFWGADDRERIGWQPRDSADPYADRLTSKTTSNPIAERYQGGMDCIRP